MSAVLGISAHYHDAAAALVVDGRIVGALQQERVSRVKHDPGLPLAAAAAVLSLAGIEAAALDRVVYYENPYAKVERVLVHALRTFPGSFRSLRQALASQLGEKLWVLDELASGLGVPRSRVSAVHHHQSHAAAALYTQADPNAAVLTVDGVGEWATTGIWKGVDGALVPIEMLEFPHSLGLLYAAVTAWLGFAVNGGEYKVMGLAAFGTPRHLDAFTPIIQLAEDGSFTLEPRFFADFNDPELGYGPAFVQRLGPARPRDMPWDLGSPEDQRRADVAATVQHIVENALLGLVHRAHQATGARTLCLAGGVALNAVANRRIQVEGPFDTLWVQPAAGDAGGALGAALLGAAELGDALDLAFSPFLGLPSQAGRARAVATELGLLVTEPTDPAHRIAECLERDELVGLCSGRCEWGPRALGARSLLANPRAASTRDAINARVKHREPFRPFAPAVREAQCARHFEGAADALTQMMTSVRRVTKPHELGAVTHIDGSARVQTVPSGDSLLSGVLDHLPVVLNTSLNGGGEPICGTEVDALSFFLKHPIDALFVDNLEIRRP